VDVEQVQVINNESLTVCAQLGVMRSVEQVESEVIAQSPSQPSAVVPPLKRVSL